MIVMANDVIAFIGFLTLAALCVGLGGLSWAPMVCMFICGSTVWIPLILDPSPGGAGAAMGFLWPVFALVGCVVALFSTPGESIGKSAVFLSGFVAVVCVLTKLETMFRQGEVTIPKHEGSQSVTMLVPPTKE